MMKNKQKIILLLVFVMVSALMANGQESLMLFKLGGALPMAEFGEKDFEDEKAGGASIGGTIGLEYIQTINDNGLGLFGGLDVMFNPLSSDMKDDIEEFFDNPDDVTHFNYICIPLSGGIVLKSSINKTTQFIGQAGVTYNFLKATNLEVSDDFMEGTAVMKFDVATSLGVKFGGGFLLNDKTMIELTYWALGEHTITGEAEFNSETYDIEDVFDVDKIKRKINILAISIGFKF